MKKRILALLLAGAMVFGLSACGSSSDKSSDQSSDAPSESQPAESSDDSEIGRASCRERV